MDMRPKRAPLLALALAIPFAIGSVGAQLQLNGDIDNASYGGGLPVATNPELPPWPVSRQPASTAFRSWLTALRTIGITSLGLQSSETPSLRRPVVTERLCCFKYRTSQVPFLMH